MHYHKTNWETPEGRLKSNQRTKRRLTSPGSHIADLAALSKCICLCSNCTCKFSPKGVKYHLVTRPPLGQGAIGECDGCNEQNTMCKVFMPDE